MSRRDLERLVRRGPWRHSGKFLRIFLAVFLLSNRACTRALPYDHCHRKIGPFSRSWGLGRQNYSTVIFGRFQDIGPLGKLGLRLSSQNSMGILAQLLHVEVLDRLGSLSNCWGLVTQLLNALIFTDFCLSTALPEERNDIQNVERCNRQTGFHLTNRTETTS